MATQITANLPTLNFPREVDYPTQEDWAAFSAPAELNFGILGGSWSTQMQLWKTQANTMSTELNNSANIAQSTVNYKGDWISQGYALNESVSVGGIYYICKLTHATAQNPTAGGSLYWNLVIGNWALKADKTEVALKVDNNMSAYTTKTTPVDADLIPLSDSAASFGIKKLSWVNLKATLTTYFNTLYLTLTGNQTVGGIKTFTSSPIVPTPTAQDNSTKVATTAYVDGNIGVNTASLLNGGIGSYAFLVSTSLGGTFTAGATYSGSGLKYTGVNGDVDIANSYSGGASGSVTGTWRAMGACWSKADRCPSTIFLRIA